MRLLRHCISAFSPALPAWLALLALAACGRESAPQAEAPRPVAVVAARLVDLDDRIVASGQLHAKERAVIASEVAGRITAVSVDEGDAVQEGQRLLAIDPERRELAAANARAVLGEAEAALGEAQRAYNRAKALRERGIASQSLLDERATALSRARSRRAAARAQLGVAQRALRDAQVRAPFGGLVARREVSRGEYVKVGQPLFEIVALDPIEVEFSVSERDSARVKLGQPVAVRVAPYPDEVLRGEVSVISPTIDVRTHTLRVKARVPNAEGRLRPGLFAHTDLGLARRKNVLVVPEEAVLLRADGEVVFVVSAEDRAQRSVVQTGAQRDGLIEITGGLRAGDLVAVRGHASLADGALVSRRRSDGSPEAGAAGSEQRALDVAAEPDPPGQSL